jgi:hypothetical protein
MTPRLEIPTDNAGRPWRSITIRAEDAHGSTWDKLRHEYHHCQHRSHLRDRKVTIYWREKDGEHTFVFSPNAALEALRNRLKGIPLSKIAAPDTDRLLADGFSWTDHIGDRRP